MIINLVSYIVIYYSAPEDPKAEMEDKIYKGASKEVEKLEETYKQQDPSFPDVKLSKYNIDYDKEGKSVWIAMGFEESLPSDKVGEFAEAIAKGAFGATSSDELMEVEVLTVINDWPQPYFFERYEFE
jgi:hypothetical protein